MPLVVRLDGNKVEEGRAILRDANHPLVTLADTSCGYGCVANLPAKASGFTTVELKSNHLGTALEGTIASLTIRDNAFKAIPFKAAPAAK